MAKHILHCSSCDKYTMQEQCPQCQQKTISRIPPKYSPEDKYARYRREAKQEARKEEGLV